MQLTHIEQAAQIWSAGWLDGHADIVPAELVEMRAREDFSPRLRCHAADTRVAVSGDQVLGFCSLKGDELYQMYVSSQARGLGVAQALMVDAEARLTQAGYQTTWLSCAVGNLRASRFYQKSGWSNAGLETVDLETSQGAFALQLWRFEKALG